MKIALGGALYAISGNINSVEEAARYAESLYCTVLYCTVLYCTVLYRYAESLAEAARQFELDGVDLDVEDGGSPVEIQVRGEGEEMSSLPHAGPCVRWRWCRRSGCGWAPPSTSATPSPACPSSSSPGPPSSPPSSQTLTRST